MKGKAWKFGDNIDTDLIIPARYLNTSDPQELAEHCMEDADASWVTKKKSGDFIVAGENFGCGSSREHAPIAIKAAGVSAVIAKSFARIFYRNAINIGLPILECPEAADEIKEGDEIEVNLAKGEIKNLTSKMIYHAQPFPEFMQKLIKAGGLISYIKKKLKS
ncbi:3-isopropylmalate dehydratase small subunit [candidate division WOR-1 bacterium RIFOXYB2_FULL_42_35]|uniref:3-isopropylmalate dehydratase small subunit n=1 Tax=candidate division WOR-1 bacterium RIFOXYC2_FULL_41_25 TaxID=1802586 RepID=A0A1F4TS69_UNCSA|nr:MAG: 3-isopropylmalate dehydratase small subunit [candidate division WOR-1 bacterium RIFOXYA2_FULL_41_14]OGC27400.1 MAG: 3-isopropylmalate dehydratase small subunit [candidate division WOR-1 bacterium RIFOXYB2_FULL_42_35]OGC35439.1 MAG: 3-isopropylmalate dehydratase small subunit [candidate division WOR-1 bacterium RIFOXYC2_FULL_41_25]OGC44082.1 MAG: 3-isopropylmalate dehydratase small subunit [candidate division WOR-1 bacterium RIFOXYD2_FULL_41_8]